MQGLTDEQLAERGEQAVEIRIVCALPAEATEQDAAMIAGIIEEYALTRPPADGMTTKPVGRVVESELRPLTVNDVERLLP